MANMALDIRVFTAETIEHIVITKYIIVTLNLLDVRLSVNDILKHAISFWAALLWIARRFRLELSDYLLRVIKR